ncbi:hypothetical protein ACJJTC_009796 [Scirpophaga incertulas]
MAQENYPRLGESCNFGIWKFRVKLILEEKGVASSLTESQVKKNLKRKKELYRHVEVEQEAEEPMYTSEDNESKEKDDDDKCEENIRENQDDENIQGIEEYRTKSGRQAGEWLREAGRAARPKARALETPESTEIVSR